jgi:hypothetical protein
MIWEIIQCRPHNITATNSFCISEIEEYLYYLVGYEAVWAPDRSKLSDQEKTAAAAELRLLTFENKLKNFINLWKSEEFRQSQSHIVTDGQSVSMSWCQAQIWDI